MDHDDLAERPAIYVDIAGDPALAGRLKRAMGAKLVRTIAGGRPAPTRPSSGFPRQRDAEGDPAFFFAPEHLPRLQALWGASALRDRLAVSWTDYVATVAQTTTFRVLSGRTAIAAAYDQVVRGSATSDTVTILTAPAIE